MEEKVMGWGLQESSSKDADQTKGVLFLTFTLLPLLFILAWDTEVIDGTPASHRGPWDNTKDGKKTLTEKNDLKEPKFLMVKGLPYVTLGLPPSQILLPGIFKSKVKNLNNNKKKVILHLVLSHTNFGSLLLHPSDTGCIILGKAWWGIYEMRMISERCLLKTAAASTLTPGARRPLLLTPSLNLWVHLSSLKHSGGISSSYLPKGSFPLLI